MTRCIKQSPKYASRQSNNQDHKKHTGIMQETIIQITTTQQDAIDNDKIN